MRAGFTSHAGFSSLASVSRQKPSSLVLAWLQVAASKAPASHAVPRHQPHQRAWLSQAAVHALPRTLQVKRDGEQQLEAEVRSKRNKLHGKLLLGLQYQGPPAQQLPSMSPQQQMMMAFQQQQQQMPPPMAAQMAAPYGAQYGAAYGAPYAGAPYAPGYAAPPAGPYGAEPSLLTNPLEQAFNSITQQQAQQAQVRHYSCCSL
jgi:hypothetical protein